MTIVADTVDRLTDQELLAALASITARERAATAEFIAALAELDRRRLYLAQGFASLYAYCAKGLYLSEHEAYLRMRIARAVQSYPIILQLIADGALTLTGAVLLAPHLTRDNYCALLEDAKHKCKREIEEQIAAIRPQPAEPSTIRKLSVPARGAQLSADDSDAQPGVTVGPEMTTVVSLARLSLDPNVVIPLSSELYKVQICISRETNEILRRIQDLMRHAVPNGDPAVIITRALQLLLADLERRKTAHTERPHRFAPCKSGTRYVPAHVRREVWRRDRGRCAFVGTEGRCQETGFLEFHHLIPYADGGETSVDNLELRCRAHNVYEAELHFAVPPQAEAGPLDTE